MPKRAFGGGTTATKTRTAKEEKQKYHKMLSGFNNALASALQAFMNYDSETSVATLSRMWEYGRRVEELRNHPEYTKPKDAGGPPVNPIQELAKLINRSVSYLNKTAQLYRAFPTEPKRRELLSMQLANGLPVTWNHFDRLLVLFAEKGNNAAFEKMRKKMISDSLSPDELDQLIRTQGMLSGSAPHAGGRPVKVPTTARARIGNLNATVSTFLTKAAAIYNHDTNGISPSIRSLSQESLAGSSKELIAELLDTRNKVSAMLAEIGKILPAIDAAVGHINDCTVSHQEVTAAKEVDAIEAEDMSVAGAVDTGLPVDDVVDSEDDD